MANVSKYYDDEDIWNALRNTDSGRYGFAVGNIEVVRSPTIANATPTTTFRVITEYTMSPADAQAILDEAEAATKARTGVS